MDAHQSASAEPYVVRRASAHDVDVVARIWHVGWGDGHAGHVPPELVRHRNEKQFAARARERLECMWVAESRDQIVGFVVVKRDEVEQIYVDRTARGTGVAATLLHEAEAEIRSAGHRRAWLAVVAGNQRARSFYSRLGWRDSGVIMYAAETEVGPFTVPTHRYEIDLTDPVPDDRAERAVTEPTEDFAAMFEASIQAKRFEKGQTLEGTIVAIGREVAFVDVGGKGEATIDIDELKDAEGDLEVAVGDRVQAMVVSTVGGLTLSRKLARGAATERQLEDAFHTGLPVEGKVERAVKGGYEVRIARQRAFCPTSQIDTLRTDPSVHEGRVYEFRIIEYKERGRNLVVSRRALLEEEQRASAAEIRGSIAAGAVMTGRVTSVREFGAFVDLGGGVQGLLHVSEMGWSRVSDTSQVVQPGDEITVKVLRVDDDKQKISLGLKQLTADPWLKVHETYEIGQVRTGRVTRLAAFGAFVELEPGVEALAHASTFAPTGRSEGAPATRGEWSSAMAPEMTGAFEILSIDVEKKRIGVALVPEGSVRAGGTAPSQPDEAEEVREYSERGDAAPAEGFGSLADKLRGALEPREK